MNGLHERLLGYARLAADNFGLPGMFVVAFFDSSFLSLPEVNDLLVVTFSLHAPDRFWQYAVAAALGSVAGSLILHSLGKKGGAPLLARVGPERQAWLERAFRRFDLLAVVVPSLLPPPCPFKIFVLASGVFGMPWPRFLAAVLFGRLTRYLVEGWLAVNYGREVLAFARQHGLLVLGLVAALIALALAGRAWMWRRAQR